jgi:hypothetical protein
MGMDLADNMESAHFNNQETDIARVFYVERDSF